MASAVATPAPVPAPAAAPTTPASFQSVSLYVGDLHGDVTEANLFEVFSQVGTVQSIRVCRDIITRRSLGYAYVNYTQQADAERAMDTINGSEIKGRPCRIMWSQRDPSLRKSGKGNIFIKNLDKKIDIKALHDTFSQFGNILSCKIELDSKGESKGYGYIQFAENENAVTAIEKVNGMMLLDKPVFVGQFVPRRERIQANSTKEFTNIFIKNLDEKVDEEKLKSLFSQFGALKSVAIMRDENDNNKSKGFGFVNFEDAADASNAVNELNGKDVQGKAVFVGRAMKKSEREAELRQKFEALKLEQMTQYHGVNLYVKNIDDEIDSDDKLRNIFTPYGTITSAKIMKDNRSNLSKGFGFVCFATPEEATKAVSELNGKMIAKKPLYVALHERKEIRRSKLEQHFAQRSKMAPRMPVAYPNGQPVYYQQQPQMVFPPMMPRNRFPQSGPGAFPMQPYMMMSQPGARGGRGAFINGGQMRGGAAMRGRGGIQGQGKPQQALASPQAPGSAAAAAPADGAQQQPQAPAGGAALNSQLLDGLSAEERKRVLGEHLYPLIQRQNMQLAGKITGMILESADAKEVISLIEQPPALTSKVNEALEVLNAHQKPAE